MRALLISLLAFSAAPVLAQEAPTAATPMATPPVPATTSTAAAAPATPVPVIAATPASQDNAISASQATDPLADLIARSGPQTTDEEEPAAQAPLPPHKPTILPIPAPEPTEDPAKPPPQSGYVPTAEAYDLRIKGSIVAAQGLQGPMDGGWSLMGPDGARLYDLQIVDPVGGYGALEGAWRDVRRPGTVGSTGLIDFVDRASGDFVTRFSPRPGTLAVVTLRPRGDGTWSGALDENGVATAITARRVAQAELPPGYTPSGRGPVIWPRPASAAPRAVAEAPRGPACSTKGKKGKALKAAKAKCATAAKKAGKGSAAKGHKGGKGKAVASKKGKGSAKGKAARGSGKKKR